MKRRSVMLLCVLVLGDVAFSIGGGGGGGGGGGSAPTDNPNAWWPKGKFTYRSTRGEYSDTINFAELWTQSRLDKLRDLSKKGTFRDWPLDAMETNFSWGGSAKAAYSDCRSWSDMPDWYDDCGTNGVLETDPNWQSFGFGTFSSAMLKPNVTYNSNIRMYKNTHNEPIIGHYMPSNLYHEAVHCQMKINWFCGVNKAQKEIYKDFEQKDMELKYGRIQSMSYE